MSDGTRTIVVQIRLLPSERDILAHVADNLGLPVSTCIRLLALRAAQAEMDAQKTPSP